MERDVKVTLPAFLDIATQRFPLRRAGLWPRPRWVWKPAMATNNSDANDSTDPSADSVVDESAVSEVTDKVRRAGVADVELFGDGGQTTVSITPIRSDVGLDVELGFAVGDSAEVTLALPEERARSLVESIEAAIDVPEFDN